MLFNKRGLLSWEIKSCETKGKLDDCDNVVSKSIIGLRLELQFDAVVSLSKDFWLAWVKFESFLGQVPKLKSLLSNSVLETTHVSDLTVFTFFTAWFNRGFAAISILKKDFEKESPCDNKWKGSSLVKLFKEPIRFELRLSQDLRILFTECFGEIPDEANSVALGENLRGGNGGGGIMIDWVGSEELIRLEELVRVKRVSLAWGNSCGEFVGEWLSTCWK